MKDPLLIITVVVSVCLLALFGRYLVTGNFDKDVAGVLATMLGGLFTALSTRPKPKEEPPASPPPPSLTKPPVVAETPERAGETHDA